MKPPTEEQLNEEVDDGYGLKWEGEPSWFIQAEINHLKMELMPGDDQGDGHRQVEKGEDTSWPM
jgi:hypothetical protein